MEGLFVATQNKRQATHWSFLLLGVSLRAAARASVSGVSRGFSDDSVAKNTPERCPASSTVWSVQMSCTLSEHLMH